MPPEKGIDLVRQNIAISKGGVEIRYQNKPSHFGTNSLVYLLLDCSGSMENGQKFTKAKSGLLKFAKEAISKGYSVGLIQFGSYATHLCDPQRELTIFDRSLMAMKICGSTNMTDAIRLATQKLLNKDAAKVICIVTDGFPDDPQTTLNAAQNAKQNRIDIITIGTDDADHEFLKKLATRAELGIKVSRNQFEQTIASTAKMLPGK